jgi:hypothetical protein
VVLQAAQDHAQKKSAHAAEQRRSMVNAAREAWFDGQLDLDPTRIVFIDETAANTKMALELTPLDRTRSGLGREHDVFPG